MNRRALVVGTAVIGVAAIAAGAAFYPTEKPEAAPTLPPENSNLVRPHSIVVGPSDAPVTIVEFLDPSCEACRAFYPVVKQIMARFPEQTRLVIRYAPLHEGSDEAVRLLEAARIQNLFTPVLEKLFDQQDQWAVHGAPDLNKLWSLAGEAGLDVAKARQDARSPAVVRVLNQDLSDMKVVDVQATPTFFVNGKPLAEFGANQLLDLVAAEVATSEGQATTQ